MKKKYYDDDVFGEYDEEIDVDDFDYETFMMLLELMKGKNIKNISKKNSKDNITKDNLTEDELIESEKAFIKAKRENLMWFVFDMLFVLGFVLYLLFTIKGR